MQVKARWTALPAGFQPGLPGFDATRPGDSSPGVGGQSLAIFVGAHRLRDECATRWPLVLLDPPFTRANQCFDCTPLAGKWRDVARAADLCYTVSVSGAQRRIPGNI